MVRQMIGYIEVTIILLPNLVDATSQNLKTMFSFCLSNAKQKHTHTRTSFTSLNH